MTREQREAVRRNFRNSGFAQVRFTPVPGSGLYTEVWRHSDGTEMTVVWARLEVPQPVSIPLSDVADNYVLGTL